MKSPRLPPDHPDRVIELEQEMESHLVALMDRAKDAGWDQEEIAKAVINLAVNYVHRLRANEETDRQIAQSLKDGGNLH